MPRSTKEQPKSDELEGKARADRWWRGCIFQRKDRPGSLWIKWTDSTGRRRQALGARGTDDAAREAAGRRLVEETGKVAADAARGVRAVTIEEFWNEVESEARSRLAPRQFPNHRAQVLRCAGAFPDSPMCDIAKSSLVAYFHQIKAEGKRLKAPKGKKPGTGPVVPLSHATLVRHRAALGKLWDEAIERRAALVNVPLSVPLSEFGKRQEREPRYFTPEQLATLYRNLPREIAPLVVLLGETGARFAEIAGERRTVKKGEREVVGGLTWADVAHDDSSVTFANPKNGRARTVPTTERARTLLGTLRERRVVPLRGEDRVLAAFPTAHNYCLRTFHAGLEAAGLPKAGFHALRHSYCAGLVSAGVPLNVTMQLAGHSSLALTTRYARHAPASAAVQGVLALEKARASAARKGRRKGEQRTA